MWEAVSLDTIANCQLNHRNAVNFFFFLQVFHFCFAIVCSQEKLGVEGEIYIYMHEASIGLVLPRWESAVVFSLVSRATHIHASILSEVISLPKYLCQFQGIKPWEPAEGEREHQTWFSRDSTQKQSLNKWTFAKPKQTNKQTANQTDSPDEATFWKPARAPVWGQEPRLAHHSSLDIAIFSPWVTPAPNPAANSSFACKWKEGTGSR